MDRGGVCLGLRVVRGPDWEWGDQDGGEGHVGTVVADEPARKAVVVQWDCSERCRYRCGHQDKYDLRVLDRGPTGLRHYNVICNWCDEQPTGVLWKCAHCYDYVLCSKCYNTGKHTVEHSFNRCDRLDQKMRTRVKPRFYSKKVSARGTFSGAQVMRGADWQWDNQDGQLGNIGNVTKVDGWERQSFRSIVEVVWTGLSSKNVYRVGHVGKVDLKCISPAFGGHYYPEHLEVLGAPYLPPNPSELSAGDAVRVELDPDLFRIAQEDHGGWNDVMAEFIGRVGVVNTVQDCGDVVVRYSNNKIFLLNQYALTKVDVPVFGYGEVVRILDDIAKVHSLQAGHGEWNDDMALSLGQVGRVVKIQANSTVRVAVNGRRWVMNPKCMLPAPSQTPQEDFLEEVQVDRGTKLHIASLSQADVPDVVATAAAAGDAAAIFSYLSKHPEEVNTKVEGASPLHLAIVEGFMSVLKTIIHFKPDLNIDGENGEKPLHVCAYTNNGVAAKLLIDAGAKVNARAAGGNTPLSLAAALGHCNVVKALLDCPHTDINSQDSEGKTPLHCAVFSQQREAVHILLEAGANPSFLDFSLGTPFHKTAGFGFLAGIEEFLRYYPEHVNIQKDDGYTPLHMAAANNHADILSLVASSPRCDINARTNTRLTALHIAVHEGRVKLVERLVGFGADLDLTTDEGNTALHIALGRTNMSTAPVDSPRIRAIQDEVEIIHGMNVVPANVVVAMFLVSQGAKMFIKNNKGTSPLQLCPADMSELIRQHRGHGDPYYGSLKVDCKPFTEPQRLSRHRPVKQSTSAEASAALAGAAVGASANFANPNIAHVLPVRMEKLNLEASSKAQQLMLENKMDAGTTQPTANGGTKVDPKLRENMSNNQKLPNASNFLNQSPQRRYPKLSECVLCEKASDIQLFPCKHIAFCHPCRDSVKAIKRCPKAECRTPVLSIQPVCVQCHQPRSTLIARTPCEHHYCTDCNAGLDHCIACRAFAEQEHI